MYATIRNYASAAGLADAVAENRDEILGIFGGIDGFRHYFIVKTGPGSAVSLPLAMTSNSAGTEMRRALVA